MSFDQRHGKKEQQHFDVEEYALGLGKILKSLVIHQVRHVEEVRLEADSKFKLK